MLTRSLFLIFRSAGFQARAYALGKCQVVLKWGRRIAPSFSSSPEKWGWAWKPILLTLLLAGCRKPDEIVRYTVARPAPIQTAADTDSDSDEAWVPGQLLGAIVPHGQSTWFFKLTGRLELVKPQLESFLVFMKSVRFTDNGPGWTLPEGWAQLPASDIRFATLKIPTEKKPLELTVIPLPTAAGDFEDYLLSNVNRWREQLRQEPISKTELPDRTVKIELGDTPAWLVNFEGEIREGGTAMPPFAGQQGPRTESPPSTSSPSPAGDRSLPFTCEVPESWRPVQANAMQLAAYEAGKGRQKVVISISSAGGNLAANINRWREQVHLAPLEGAELGKTLEEFTVDGNQAVFVEFVGPEDDPEREALLGVIVAAQKHQWFIKLRGDAALAEREKEHFQKFVQSIRFRGE
jgi:hypothetical protein